MHISFFLYFPYENDLVFKHLEEKAHHAASSSLKDGHGNFRLNNRFYLVLEEKVPTFKTKQKTSQKRYFRIKPVSLPRCTSPQPLNASKIHVIGGDRRPELEVRH